MSETKFKTMRHIETVRNFLNCVIGELLKRQERHDQTKLESPEFEIFEEFTPKLQGVSYGSPQYKQYMQEMGMAIKHHNSCNRHHPEHFPKGIKDMTLIDLIEMICDWKAANLRCGQGCDIYHSIDINQKRFGYSDELKAILINTALFLDHSTVRHYAEQS